MSMAVQGRGHHLIDADRGFASGGLSARLVGHLPSAFYHRLIDRIEQGFTHGSIDALLPDGSRRVLQGREPGPQARLTVHKWQALARLALAGSVGWFRGSP
jgi:cyclopropane-fatty-acyl-phospholipid synthase